jgi:S1-C subfamily serine protease
MPGETGRGNGRGAARETRLLILTLVISVAVLVLLAQFRLPDRSQRPAAPPATALDELAARGAYEAQAATLRELARRLDGSLVVLRASARSASGSVGEPVVFTGIRIRDTLALAGLPESIDAKRDGMAVLNDDRWVDAGLVGTDGPRRLVVVRVPARPAPVLVMGSQSPRAPGYFAAAVGTAAGPSLNPVWVGALAFAGQTAWSGPVWMLPPSGTLFSGMPLYSIDGALVGLVNIGVDGRLLVPAALALGVASELAIGRSLTGSDAGCDVVDLNTPALRAAAGRSDGVLVGWVDPVGPASGQLETGDVIVGMDEDFVSHSSDLRRTLARREPGTRATLSVVRSGQKHAIAIVLRAPPQPANAADPPQAAASPRPRGAGLTLRDASDGVVVVRVDPRGAAAGLVTVGERITWVRGVPKPTSSTIVRAFEELPSGGALLLRVAPEAAADRTTTVNVPERVVAVLKP